MTEIFTLVIAALLVVLFIDSQYQRMAKLRRNDAQTDKRIARQRRKL